MTLHEGQLRSLLMQLRALQRMKCGWHLCFCTDFSSSVPLGSQFGTSLPRRCLSSPLHLYYTLRFIRNLCLRGAIMFFPDDELCMIIMRKLFIFSHTHYYEENQRKKTTDRTCDQGRNVQRIRMVTNDLGC